MSIFVCGDIHSTLDINKLDGFIGREDLNENDYLIILLVTSPLYNFI